MNINQIREKIQSLRKDQGLSQEDFSKKIGVSRSHYAKIECGQKTPTLATLLKITNELNATVLIVKSNDVTP